MSYNLWRSVVNPSRSWLLRESSKMNFIESSMRSAHTGSPVGLRIDKVQPGLTPGRYAPQAPVSGIGLVPGCNILCYPNILIFRNLHSLYNCIVLGLIRDIMSTKYGKRLFSLPFYISIPLAILNLNTMVEVSLVNQYYGLTLHSVPAIISSVKRGGGAMNISTSQIVHHTGYESSYIPLAYRREVLRRDHNSCKFCKKETEMLCHDLPKCRGGKTEPANLLTCCEDCRREKEEFTATEYLALRLGCIDFPTEVKAMRIKVIFASGKEVVGIVDNLPTPETKAFWLRYPGNGARELIYTMPGMRIIELGGEK